MIQRSVLQVPKVSRKYFSKTIDTSGQVDLVITPSVLKYEMSCERPQWLKERAGGSTGHFFVLWGTARAAQCPCVEVVELAELQCIDLSDGTELVEVLTDYITHLQLLYSWWRWARLLLRWRIIREGLVLFLVASRVLICSTGKW